MAVKMNRVRSFQPTNTNITSKIEMDRTQERRTSAFIVELPRNHVTKEKENISNENKNKRINSKEIEKHDVSEPESRAANVAINIYRTFGCEFENLLQIIKLILNELKVKCKINMAKISRNDLDGYSNNLIDKLTQYLTDSAEIVKQFRLIESEITVSKIPLSLHVSTKDSLIKLFNECASIKNDLQMIRCK